MTDEPKRRTGHPRVAIRFGKNLASVRRRVRMSQEELAWRAQLHRTEIGLLERGLRGGRIETLIRLAGAMEVDVTDLLAGIVWKPAEEGGGGEFIVGELPEAVARSNIGGAR